MTDERRRRYHESGHAVAAVAFGRWLDTVTVVPGSHWGGITVHMAAPPGESVPPEVAAAYAANAAELAALEAELPPPAAVVFWPPAARAATEAQIVVSLAGEAAEELLETEGGAYRDEHPDEIEAERLAVDLATTSPRHAELVAAHSGAHPDDIRAMAQSAELAGPEAAAHYQLMRLVARRLVAERWPQVDALAEALRTHPILDGFAAELVIEKARKAQEELTNDSQD